MTIKRKFRTGEYLDEQLGDIKIQSVYPVCPILGDRNVGSCACQACKHHDEMDMIDKVVYCNRHQLGNPHGLS